MAEKYPEFKLTPREHKLKGNVKSMIFSSYHAKRNLFGIKKLGPGASFVMPSFEHLIFKNGLLVTEEGEDIMHDFFRKEYTYNNNKLIIVQEYSHHLLTKQLKATFTDELYHNTNCEYEVIRSNAGDRLDRRVVIINDDLVSEAVYGEFNELKERVELKYDEKGRVLSRVEFSVYDVEFADNEPECDSGKEYVADKHVYAYDDNGFLISEQNYIGDDDGAMIENYRMEYTNDIHGNPVLSVNIEPDGIVEILKFEYKYDNRGNWIQRKQYEAEEWDENDSLKHKASLKYIAESKISYE